jgi:hypothetical protein
MSLDGFWAAIDAQLEQMRTARTPADVVRILGSDPNLQDGRAQAFFAGGGGDSTPIDPLTEHAGWTVAWYNARYHYALKAPEGGYIEYVEGDIYASDTLPRPLPNGGE